VEKPGEIIISFVNDRFIKKLNSKYLSENRPTDVLAFAGACADIIISADTAARNAKIYKTHPQYELCLYAVHGILHLLGYEDRTRRQRDRMQKKAESILAKWAFTKQKSSS
jgi:probable rRNA maturation factor